jgi:hypothetical protein
VPNPRSDDLFSRGIDNLGDKLRLLDLLLLVGVVFADL